MSCVRFKHFFTNLNMKTLFLFFIAFVLLFGYNANAQTDEDNITYLRVQNQIKDSNYRQGVNLLKQMSPQARQSPFFETYSAQCYENLQVYDSAAFFYKRVYTRTKDFKAMQKAAEMDDKQDAKLRCTKCRGTGLYTAEFNCTVCNGSGSLSKECYFCCNRKTPNIPGKCYYCHGNGLTPYNNNCAICGGDGVCSKCKGSGTTASSCYQCNSTGRLTRVLTCNH